MFSKGNLRKSSNDFWFGDEKAKIEICENENESIFKLMQRNFASSVFHVYDSVWMECVLWCIGGCGL